MAFIVVTVTDIRSLLLEAIAPGRKPLFIRLHLLDPGFAASRCSPTDKEWSCTAYH